MEQSEVEALIRKMLEEKILETDRRLPGLIPQTESFTAPPRYSPGIRTTEFWLTVGVNLLNGLITMEVLSPTEQWGKIAATVVAALASVGYVAGRAYVKARA